MDNMDYFLKVLGLAPGASEEAIKEAHHDLITVWRPDKYAQDPRLQQKAIEKLKEIDEAYRALMGKAGLSVNVPRQNKVELQQPEHNAPHVASRTETGPAGESVSDPSSPTGAIVPDTRLARKYGSTDGDRTVGGWLLTLCIFMTFIWPITGISTAFVTMHQADNPFRAISFWLQFAGSLFLLYVGIQLWRVKAGAVTVAKHLFVVMTILSGLGLFLGETKLEMIQGLVGIVLCFVVYLYLSNSKRVQCTYGISDNKSVAKKNPNHFKYDGEQARELARQQLRDAFNSVNKDLSTTEGIPKVVDKQDDPVAAVVLPLRRETGPPIEAENGDSAKSGETASLRPDHGAPANQDDVSALEEVNKHTAADPILGMPGVDASKGPPAPLFFRVVGFLIMSLVVSVIALFIGFSLFESKHTSAPNQRRSVNSPSGNATAENARGVKSSSDPSGHMAGSPALTAIHAAHSTQSANSERAGQSDAPYVRVNFETGASINVPRGWRHLNRETKEAINFFGESNRETILKRTGLPANKNPNRVLFAAHADGSIDRPSAMMRLSVRQGDYPTQLELVGVEPSESDRAEMKWATNQILSEVRHTMPSMIRGHRVIDVGVERLGNLYSLVSLMQIDYVHGTYIERLDQIFMGDRVYKLHTSYLYTETSNYEFAIQNVRNSLQISQN